MQALQEHRPELAAARRQKLQRARLMLILSAEGGAGSINAVLAEALAEVDLVQVRVKPGGLRSGPSPAAALRDLCLEVLAALRCLPPERRPLVIVNDRVDVAALLAGSGVDGVHLGQGDAPPALARAALGPEALIGRSTRTARQILASEDEPVDYLGFGPIFPSATKGYERGLGSELAWTATEACSRPLFPIGGIDLTNAIELAPVGRAAVGAAILEAREPARAARELRALLER